MNHLSSLQADQLREIGTYLRQKREENALSVEDIAAITRIRLPMLEALENGEIDRLPELIYVKGFIRRYGEAVGIDGKALSDRLSPSAEQLIQQAATPKTLPKKVSPPPTPAPARETSERAAKSTTRAAEPRTERAPSVSKYLWLGILAGICTGLGYFLYLFLRPPVTNPIEATPLPPSPSPVASPSPVVSPSPVASPAPSPARAVPLTMVVTIDNASWVRVKADGRTVHEGILKSGTERTWTAQESLNIRAGNAGGVKVSVNDLPPEVMGPLGQIGDRTFTAR